jgi:ribonucleoside-diphosphate reductase alpha chain
MMRDQGFVFTPENGQTEENATTRVVSFPIKAPKGAIFRNDVTAIQQLEWYKHIQENWCEHNASISVYCKDNEWLSVANWVYENWDIVNGVSFFPYDNSHYPQLPYEEITEAEYNKLLKKLPEIDYLKLSEYEKEDNTEGGQTYACVGGACEVP